MSVTVSGRSHQARWSSRLWAYQGEGVSHGLIAIHTAEVPVALLLPRVGTLLSLAGALRWPLVKKLSLLRAVERSVVRSIFRWQRRR